LYRIDRDNSFVFQTTSVQTVLKQHSTALLDTMIETHMTVQLFGPMRDELGLGMSRKAFPLEKWQELVPSFREWERIEDVIPAPTFKVDEPVLVEQTPDIEPNPTLDLEEEQKRLREEEEKRLKHLEELVC
jgi:hypothetical protein